MAVSGVSPVPPHRCWTSQAPLTLFYCKICGEWSTWAPKVSVSFETEGRLGPPAESIQSLPRPAVSLYRSPTIIPLRWDSRSPQFSAKMQRRSVWST